MIQLRPDMVKKLRKAADMTQAKLARDAKVSRHTVMRIEAGQVESVTFETVNGLARALKVDADVLVTFEK